MITVEIYVPYLNASYDLSVDEAASIGSVIEEIVPLICFKEHWNVPEDVRYLNLYNPANNKRLPMPESLHGEGVTSGSRLILC